MPTKTTERPVTAKGPVQRGWEKDGLPGLAEALEIYRRIAQVGGVRLRPARPQPPVDLVSPRSG